MSRRPWQTHEPITRRLHAGPCHDGTEFFDPRILGLTGSPALVRRAADNFRIRYAKVREPGAENYAVDHSAGMILLGPDGTFIRKFAFATPVDEITVQLLEIMAAYQASPARR